MININNIIVAEMLKEYKGDFIGFYMAMKDIVEKSDTGIDVAKVYGHDVVECVSPSGIIFDKDIDAPIRIKLRFFDEDGDYHVFDSACNGGDVEMRDGTVFTYVKKAPIVGADNVVQGFYFDILKNGELVEKDVNLYTANDI